MTITALMLVNKVLTDEVRCLLNFKVAFIIHDCILKESKPSRIAHTDVMMNTAVKADGAL